MGTDIHMVAERRNTRTGEWELVGTPTPSKWGGEDMPEPYHDRVEAEMVDAGFTEDDCGRYATRVTFSFLR